MKTTFERSVGETTHAAADLGKEALAQAQVYLHQAQKYLAPRAQDAVHQAQEALDQALERLEPYARNARRTSARFAAGKVDAWQPHVDEALAKVSPAIDEVYARVAPVLAGASSKLADDVLPRISHALHDAAGDLEQVAAEAEARRRSGWATAGRVVLAGALLGGVVWAVKKFLEPQDSGWQAHEPSKPYVPPTTTTVVDDLSAATAKPADDAATEWVESEGTASSMPGDEPVVEAPATQTDTDTDTSEGDAAPFAGSPYGDGSWIGDGPYEGYTIKGNERSMKYHVEGNPGYERTIADVWFNSEEAAQRAGFTKAQR